MLGCFSWQQISMCCGLILSRFQSKGRCQCFTDWRPTNNGISFPLMQGDLHFQIFYLAAYLQFLITSCTVGHLLPGPCWKNYIRFLTIFLMLLNESPICTQVQIESTASGEWSMTWSLQIDVLDANLYVTLLSPYFALNSNLFVKLSLYSGSSEWDDFI